MKNIVREEQHKQFIASPISGWEMCAIVINGELDSLEICQSHRRGVTVENLNDLEKLIATLLDMTVAIKKAK